MGEEKLMSLCTTTTWYRYVNIMRNWKRKVWKIHRLVAKHFLDGIDGKLCVNHKNWNKLDNSIENLEWCTYFENNKHAVDTGLNKRDKPVSRYTMDGEYIDSYPSQRTAAKALWVRFKWISACCRWAFNNYRWYIRKYAIVNKPQPFSWYNTGE